MSAFLTVHLKQTTPQGQEQGKAGGQAVSSTLELPPLAPALISFDGGLVWKWAKPFLLQAAFGHSTLSTKTPTLEGLREFKMTLGAHESCQR